MAKKRHKAVPMSDLERAERIAVGGALIVIPMPLSNITGAGLIASTIPHEPWSAKRMMTRNPKDRQHQAARMKRMMNLRNY
jgi:hypothetical protein